MRYRNHDKTYSIALKPIVGTAMFLTVAIAFALSFTAVANIDDGLLWVFKAKEGVADGSTDSSDFRDQLTVSAATTKTLTFNYPEGYPICFTNMTVKSGVANATYENQPCLFLPQTTNWVDGVLHSYEQNATIPNAMLAKSTEGASFYARLKWLGRSRPQVGAQFPYNYDFSFFDNGHVWSETGRGWIIRFGLYGNSPRGAYLEAVVKDKRVTASSGNLVTDEAQWVAGKIMGNACDIYAPGEIASYEWVDIAVTFRYASEEGRTYITFFKCPSGGHDVAIARGFVERSLAAPTGNGKVFGATTAEEHVGGATSGNFRGAVSEMRLWNRCLSEEEVRTVFAGQPQGWRIGADNGSADEFSDTECTSDFSPRTMQWSKMRKTLTAANPSVSLTATFPADRRNLPRVLRIKPIISEDAAGAQLDIRLNGTKIGTVKLRGGDNFFFVREQAFNRFVGSDGVATFTLTRTGNMAGTVMFDFLELTGSFQIGNRDNANGSASYSEFTWGTGASILYAAAEDTTIYRANLPPEKTMDIWFPLVKAVADHYKFRFSTHLFWQTEAQLPLTFSLNGVALQPTEELTPTRTFHFDIAPGVLQECNKFSITSGVSTRTDTGSKDYAIDYYRLDVINTDKPPFTVSFR